MKRDRAAPVTMREVARAASVDVAIVSRVLSNDARLSIRPETRQRVFDAVAQLGYLPNTAARTLRTSLARAYGLVIPDFVNGVYAQIIEGAQDAALEAGCALLTASVTAKGNERALRGILANGAIDGLMIAGADEPGELAHAFRSRGRPVLFINRRARGERRSIVLDDQGATELAVDHLVSLGHQQIGHLTGELGSDTAERRLKGFRSAVAGAGFAVHPEWIVEADYSLEGGFQAMSRLLETKPRPTAVVVASIVSALGALRAVWSAGLQVPADISVISIHDHSVAEFTIPSITTVRMPMYELGFRSVHLLHTRGADEDINEVLDETPILVQRESTRQL